MKKRHRKMSDSELLAHVVRLMMIGTIRVEGNEIVGVATDGTTVALGHCGNESILLEYLRDYPTPDKW